MSATPALHSDIATGRAIIVVDPGLGATVGNVEF